MKYPTKLKIFCGARPDAIEKEFDAWADGKFIQNFQASRGGQGSYNIFVLYTDGPLVNWGPIQPLDGPYGPIGPATVPPPDPNHYVVTCSDPTNGEFTFH